MRACVVLSNGVVGAEKQALALAEASGLPFTVRRVAQPSAALARLPTRLSVAAARILGTLPVPTPPFPAVAISCGRGSIPASIAMRAASPATLTVHVQRPQCPESWFDLVIAPSHDYPAGKPPPPNVLLTDGSLHSVSPDAMQIARQRWSAELEPLTAPRIAVLVGGTVARRWWQQPPPAPELTSRSAGELLYSAGRAAAACGGSLMVTTSRRTPPEVHAEVAWQVAMASAAGVPGRLWGADAMPNPYLGLLAWSQYVLVTADSINMVSEACAAAKPVYVSQPHGCHRRYAQFHAHQLALGRTRPWPTGSSEARLEPEELWCMEGSESAGGDLRRAAARLTEMLSSRSSSLMSKEAHPH